MEINRKRVARRLASGLLAGALAFGGLALSGASPAGAVPIDEDERIAGSDRFATAALVADQIDDLAGGVDTVIVANGRNFPDALAASSLIDEYANAALLLVEADSIPESTLNQMNRLDNDATDVIVVGGTSAVSEDVFEDIESIFDDSDVVRIAGANRYATAAEIADELGWAGDLVLLVSGENFADAVTVGGFAASTGNPILLANGSGLPAETEAALEDALDEDITRVVIVGGASAVWSGAEEALVELGFDPSGISRIAGSDRYATNLTFNLEQFATDALAVNKFMDGPGDEGLGLEGRSMIMVSGANFPDALAAAGLAAQTESHIVLVNPTSIGISALTLAGASKTSLTNDSSTSTQVTATLAEADGETYVGEEVWVVGGQSAVPDAAISTIATTASGTLGCAVIAPGSNDDGNGNGSSLVVVAFFGNLQTIAGDGDDEEEYITSTGALLELNGNDDFTALTGLDLNNDGYSDAVLYISGTELSSDDEIEFLGVEEDADVWVDGDYYGLRNIGPCSTTVAEDTDAPTAEWWGVDGESNFFVAFSEPMVEDYSDAIAGDLTPDEDAVDGASCTVADSSNQTYACVADDGGDPTGLAADNTLDLSAETYYDAAGNEADLSDFDSDVLASLPDVEVESVSVTCSTIGYGGYKSDAWDTAFGTTPTETNDGLITIVDDGSSVVATGGTDSSLVLLAGPGAGGLAANDWSFTIEHQRGLLLPTVAVEGTDATITIDRYVHNTSDVVRVWNNSQWGRGGLAPVWIAISSFSNVALFGTDSIGEAFTTADHDASISAVLDATGKGFGVANRSCSFTAELSAPLLSGVTAVTTNPASEGDFRIQFGASAQDLALQFAGDLDSGRVLEGIIDLTEDVASGVRATLYASGARTSVDG